MRDFIGKYIPDKNWFIEEKEWNRNIQALRESQFTLGNGFVGSRGILEELPFGCRPGTYIAGLYDSQGSKVPELVNLPNPISLHITTEEEKIGMVAMDVLQHKRYLNMREGTLIRHTIFQDTKGRRFDYQSIRFFSMDDKNTLAMQIFLTSLDAACNITVQTGIDTSVTNAFGVTEGERKHFRISRVSLHKYIEFMCFRTFEKKIAVSYATALKVKLGRKNWYCREYPLQLDLKKNQTVCLTKIFYLNVSEDKRAIEVEKTAVANLKKNLRLGFNNLFNRHSLAWKNLWKDADIVIKGNDEIQKNLRFNIYHLLICAYYDDGKSSIGARTLSGEGYRGHIFWDAEIFILPFFVYTNPAIAKNMLLYRYRRLEKARQIARAHGFKGAMFPWESADEGCEVTPAWAKNLDGSIIRIHTHEMEQHITADIAYAVYMYYEITGDEDFMLRYGFEILFETARFWVSRLKYNKKTNHYEIKHVIGPDEFHENVNNNAYTNMMAKWNIFTAYGMFFKMKKKHPLAFRELTEKVNLDEKEVKKWKQIVPGIYLKINNDNLIEQFSGFFKRKDIKIKELNENFMPLFPKTVALKDVGQTQLVKQADVLLLLYLLGDRFSSKTKKRNYYYYAPRTVHKSSLSPAIYSIIASEIGEISKAYRYFHISLNADIRNLHRNTNEGIHAASLGGTWQAIICGFAGMRVIKGILSFNPRVPAQWKSISFRVKWRKFTLQVTVKPGSIKLRCNCKENRRKEKLKLRIFGKLKNIYPDRTFIWIKKRG